MNSPVNDRKSSVDTWSQLEAELDAWLAHSISATFWWRDDDAATVTPALDKLLDLSVEHAAPLIVAAVPAHTDTTLALRVHETSTVTIVQHGHAHVDLSPGRRRGRSELDTDLPHEAILERLVRGRQRMASLFGGLYRPAVVPPWNRISDSLCEFLPEHGFRAVSTFGPRRKAEPVGGLRQVNAHCDIIDWKRGPRFRGAARVVGDIVEHLQQRRMGAVDSKEPTGLLTHHLDHDDQCWSFLEQLLAQVTAHPAVRFLGEETFRR
jgi:hypothetical protein